LRTKTTEFYNPGSWTRCPVKRRGSRGRKRRRRSSNMIYNIIRVADNKRIVTQVLV
jgi:hypothetical protein